MSETSIHHIHKWLGDTITIGFTPDFPKKSIYKKQDGFLVDSLEDQLNGSDNEYVVKQIVDRRLQPFMTTKLEFVSDVTSADIRIGMKPNILQLHSTFGSPTDYVPKTMATMNLNYISVRTVLMEFCYAIGMEYEHLHPKRNPIIWDHENVYKSLEATGMRRSDIDNRLFDSSTPPDDRDFDSASIMLDIPKNYVKNTDVSFGPNYIFSPIDVHRIAKAYAPTMTDQDIYASHSSMYKTNSRYIPVLISIKSGSNKKVIIGSVVGAVVVLVIGIWLYSSSSHRACIF